MASEERLRELEEKYEGFTVYDNQGGKIGKVDDLFVDESDQEEYIGVKMGFLGMKSTLIPTEIVRVNENDRTIEVAESKDRVKDAPSFDDDEDVTSEYEERIRSHFGLESLETSSGRGSYGGNPDDTTSPATPTGGAAAGSSYETGSGDRPDTHEDHDTTDSGRSSSEVTDYEAQNETQAETAGTASSGGRDTAAYEEQGTSTDREAHQDESAAGPAQGTSESTGGPGSTAYEDDRAGAGTPSGQRETSASGEEDPLNTPPTTSRQTEETETFQEGGRTKVRRRIVREEVVDADDEGS